MTALDGFVATPLFGLTLTLAVYVGAQRVAQRCGNHPLANPVLWSIVVIGGILLVTGIDYADYLNGAGIIGFFLGTATVALALPLHVQWDRIRTAAVPIVGAVVVGVLVAIVAAALITLALGGSRELALSMAPKSATAPVAIAIAEQIGGLPELTAALTILTGIVGAVLGPGILTLLRLRDPRTRGLALGVASHGIGTARALTESSVTGAFSALGMAVSTIVTPVLVAALVPWLLP